MCFLFAFAAFHDFECEAFTLARVWSWEATVFVVASERQHKIGRVSSKSMSELGLDNYLSDRSLHANSTKILNFFTVHVVDIFSFKKLLLSLWDTAKSNTLHKCPYFWIFEVWRLEPNLIVLWFGVLRASSLNSFSLLLKRLLNDRVKTFAHLFFFFFFFLPKITAHLKIYATSY